MSSNKALEAVIGLEVHAQLQTESKIFCTCRNRFGAEPNSQTCPVCIGLPGALPVLNRKVVEYAVRMGLALNCRIAAHSIFARKNYFYPDLPKGYQISQFEEPLCSDGHLEIETGNGQRRPIRINRIHLEEDAGKSVHEETYVDRNSSLVDLNRCGTPLVEIVTQPDFRSPAEAAEFLKQLRRVVQYLGISDGNMEEGSLRCDANVSLRPAGTTELGVKTEVKNMNSFKNIERALDFEIERQRTLIGEGKIIEQATLLWDADRNEIRVMRSKEEAHDYRYFPEPDLVPVEVGSKWLDSIRKDMPELPQIRRRRFETQYRLPAYDAELLTESQEIADYYERLVEHHPNYKQASNWMMGEILRVLNERKLDIDRLGISPPAMARLLVMLDENTINPAGARTVMEHMMRDREDPEAIVERLNLRQVSDSSELEDLVEAVLADHPDEVESYRAGKKKLMGFFMGQIMRRSKGKANPQAVTSILKKHLDK